MLTISEIGDRLQQDLTRQISKSGLMFRLFWRVKTIESIRHKMRIKGDSYLKGKAKMQDIIGLRIVVYFPDDVEVLSTYFGCGDVVKESIDTPDDSTFRPQRLNITRILPEEYIDDFRNALPQEYADVIDSTYEIQIRTIFSEGWHEVEHDLRYKCKEDWVGYESQSRVLNGVIATLETAEWSMTSLFQSMAHENLIRGNYSSLLRNKMRIRLKSENFSQPVADYLSLHPDVMRRFVDSDRMVILLTLIIHDRQLPLTYDNVLFLVNRLDLGDSGLQAIEDPQTQENLDLLLES
ncbi:MAG: GTP pyrophosphokinase [Bacteroidales bacterium]|nr:GTP pyrophosphokinase [Bacteroidales bacterium]